jgi:hypothetical protein
MNSVKTGTAVVLLALVGSVRAGAVEVVPGRIAALTPFYRAKEGAPWKERGRLLGLALHAPKYTAEAVAEGRIIQTDIVPAGQGLYELEWLRPGTYMLRIVAEGYRTLVVDGVKVKAGHDLYVNLEFSRDGERGDGEEAGGGGHDEREGDARDDDDEGGRDGDVRRDDDEGEREGGEGEDGDGEREDGRRGDDEGEEREGDVRRDDEEGEREGDRPRGDDRGERGGAVRRDDDEGEQEGGARRDGEDERDGDVRRDGEEGAREGDVRRDGEGDEREGGERERGDREGKVRGYVLGTIASVGRDFVILKIRGVLTAEGRAAKSSDSVEGKRARFRFARALSGRERERLARLLTQRRAVKLDVHRRAGREGLFVRRITPVGRAEGDD